MIKTVYHCEKCREPLQVAGSLTTGVLEVDIRIQPCQHCSSDRSQEYVNDMWRLIKRWKEARDAGKCPGRPYSTQISEALKTGIVQKPVTKSQAIGAIEQLSFYMSVNRSTDTKDLLPHVETLMRFREEL